MLVAFTGSAGAQAATSGPTKQMHPPISRRGRPSASRCCRTTGKWFAYVIAPNEGDATLILRSTGTDAKETKFPIGEAAAVEAVAGAGGGRGRCRCVARDQRRLALGRVHDLPAIDGRPAGTRRSRWTAVAAARPSSRGDAPAAADAEQDRARQLATGEKKEFDKVRRFAFNGDKPTWIAMQSYPERQRRPVTRDRGGGRGARRSRRRAGERWRRRGAGRAEGTDLVLYNLASGER